MKMWKMFLICLLAVSQLPASAAPKGRKEKAEKPSRVYMYGTAVNFNDSTVYLTDIQYLDSVMVKSDESLQNHASYSLQLKVYLEGTLGEANQTCAIIYSTKKRRVENHLSRMRYRYQSDKSRTLKKISVEEFKFQRH